MNILQIKGSSDGFRLVPFWKQWNALFQINIEKNKHKHNGVYIVPAPLFYYPPYDGFGYYPSNFNGIGNKFPFHGNSFQSAFRPTALQFDETKPGTAITTMV